uniref:non-specific serine/threonine protein kinase n=1 Tax=Panagrellus redivivus TaxID=6233 RepID=A0A7E4W3C5_PANRE
MSLFKPPEGLSLLLPHEKAYERIYEKNTPKEITEKLLPTILHESIFFPVSLYGHRLFHCSQTLEKEMHSVPEPKLPTRAVFSSTEDDYTIKESLGQRTYRVLGKKVNKERVLKLEWTERPTNVPRIQGSMSVLQKIKETRELFPKCEFFHHVIAFHVAGVFQERFAYYITDSYDCNLQDLLYKTLEGRPLTRTSALHIAVETLKGIHDLHLVRFMHRDIKPSNFYVGRGSNYRRIYLGGFNASYYWNDKKINDDESTLGKVRSVNARFQSRNYHTSDPMNPIDDIESWTYMVIYLFMPEKLPWRFVKSERIGYEYKCMLLIWDMNLNTLLVVT